uniref:Pentapeptide repeat-containing protein n=2 Tax=viral metagenome TaxID=1070528 RepID=A0A6M3J1A1_9ZZZZ
MAYKIKNRWTGKIIKEGESDLREADLREADLREANLMHADLREADLEFYQFPSIRLLSSIALEDLSDKLTLELMRRDAYAHPQSNLFDEWANDGPCPYRNEERFWMFNIKRELWKPGKPRMKDSDLILAICKEKGWKIKGYLT